MTSILSLATASPAHKYRQNQLAERMLNGLKLDPPRQEDLRKLYRNSAIETRHSVLENLDLLFNEPTADERNAIYKTEAPKLALSAAKKALSQWNGSPREITHVISVSCTGMMAPGIEYFLIKELGLHPTVKRIGINFMGCFGAFNGLAAAKSFANENPEHRILMVCTELCSLHAQLDLSSDSLLANALFADGAAACVIGSTNNTHPLWEIVDHASLLLENSYDYMAWDVAKSGYTMKLSTKVPVLIKKNILPFIHTLLKSKPPSEDCQWAIHPGGKDILKALEKECGLQSWQTECSWQTLKEHGNMSSATFLFVLEKLINTPTKWTCGIAFGPGLVFEGILLRR